MKNVKHLYTWSTHTNKTAEENDLDLDEGNECLCDACRLPIFSTPYKKKSTTHGDDNGNDDKSGPNSFRLHKCCADLPGVLMDHPLHPGEPLPLHDKLLDDYSGIICNECKRECSGFFYQCPDSSCRFTLNIQCAASIKILHRSHKHPLTFIPEEKSGCRCGACGMEHEGQFYECHICNYYLHRDCALLPNTIMYKEHYIVDGQQHPFVLAFNLPLDSFKFKKSFNCFICHEKLSSIMSGMYFCTRCEYATHAKCAISHANAFDRVSSRDTATGLPHFPLADENKSLIQYLRGRNDAAVEGDPFFKGKIHEHRLIMNIHDLADHELSIHCIACIDPISPPFYSCTVCSDYYLHECCAKLPVNFPHPALGISTQSDQSQLTLNSRYLADRSYTTSLCDGCLHSSNGFLYDNGDRRFKLDLKCAFLPEAITYSLHGNSHILFLSQNNNISASPHPCPCCKLDLATSFFYACGSCQNFKIHARCALLPLRVSHNYDRHPLNLMPSEDLDDKDVHICEVCEEDININLQRWFYRCKECATLFHIDCIPCAGEYSKIKFGRTVRVPGHDCPLTSIQRIKSYKYICHLCDGTIEGKEDGIAFECTKCCYWLHAQCAYYKWLRSFRLS